MDALITFFTSSFSSIYNFGSFLNNACLLMIAGTGASFAIKSGHLNLGGEGQIYLGGYIAAIILTSSWNAPAFVVFTTALVASMAAGAFMSLTSALLYEKRGASVLLTSYIFSLAVIPLIDGTITSSNKFTGSNLLATPFIQQKFRLVKLLSPSPLNISFFIAIIVCIVAYFFIYKTYAGRKMQVWGKSKPFAIYCGYSSVENTTLSLGVTGALHALTGFIAVTGTYYTCHKGFYFGLGWNALSAALIAQSNPLLIIPSSIVLSWLYYSAGTVALTQGFGFDIQSLIEGIILFIVAFPFIKKNFPKRNGIQKNKKTKLNREENNGGVK